MNEKISGSLLNGNLIAMYVLFRDGPKADQTLSFTLNNGDHINVDIDDHGDPIGVEIVYMESPKVEGVFRFDTNHRVKKEAIVRRLLAASTRLTMIRRMEEALTEEVNTCLDVIARGHMYSTTGIETTGDKPKEILCEDLKTGKYTTEREQTINSTKCCFCNADILNVIRWSVVIQKINTMGLYAGVSTREQQRHICNLCMAHIKDAMDKLDGGVDSATREGK